MTYYCNNCKRNVEPNRFSFIKFILWTVFTFGIGGIIYFIITSNPKCPICHDRNFRIDEKNMNLRQKLRRKMFGKTLSGWAEKRGL